jgi:hypothetical protein
MSLVKKNWNSGGVHPFIKGPSGLHMQEAYHKDSTQMKCLSPPPPPFMDVIQLLVAETNRC